MSSISVSYKALVECIANTLKHLPSLVETTAETSGVVKLPAEMYSTSLAVRRVPIESVGNTTVHYGMPIETASNIILSNRFDIETIIQAIAKYVLPEETVSRQNVSSRLPVEWSGALQVTLVSTCPLDWLAHASKTDRQPVEVTADILTSVRIPAETSTTTRTDALAVVEWDGGIVSVYRLPIEWLTNHFSVTVTLGTPVEWTVGVKSIQRLLTEWSGVEGSVVFRRTLSPLGARVGSRQAH
jgi:hypothetical protein